MISKSPSDDAPVRRTKAAPFKKRVEDALDAAKTAGFTHLKVKTPDGASYEFDLVAGERDAAGNPFDEITLKPAFPKTGTSR
jgi:hypothetical protein